MTFIWVHAFIWNIHLLENYFKPLLFIITVYYHYGIGILILIFCNCVYFKRNCKTENQISWVYKKRMWIKVLPNLTLSFFLSILSIYILDLFFSMNSPNTSFVFCQIIWNCVHFKHKDISRWILQRITFYFVPNIVFSREGIGDISMYM